MTFTYTKITEQYYDAVRDDTEEYGEEFEYTPSDEDVTKEICRLVYDDYFSGLGNADELKKGIRAFISDHDIQPVLEEYYHDTLKDCFRREAFDCLND